VQASYFVTHHESPDHAGTLKLKQETARSGTEHMFATEQTWKRNPKKSTSTLSTPLQSIVFKVQMVKQTKAILRGSSSASTDPQSETSKATIDTATHGSPHPQTTPHTHAQKKKQAHKQKPNQLLGSDTSSAAGIHLRHIKSQDGAIGLVERWAASSQVATAASDSNRKVGKRVELLTRGQRRGGGGSNPRHSS
jgi:hypothetical protein